MSNARDYLAWKNGAVAAPTDSSAVVDPALTNRPLAEIAFEPSLPDAEPEEVPQPFERTVEGYKAFKGGDDQAAVARAQIVRTSVVEVDPDKYAEDARRAREFTTEVNPSVVVPTDLYTANRPLFDQQIQRKRAETILMSSPTLSRWLTNPDAAIASKDDLAELGYMESFLRNTGAALGRGALRVPQGGAQYFSEAAGQRSADSGKTFGQILDEVNAEPSVFERVVGTNALTRFLNPDYSPQILATAAYRRGMAAISDALGVDEEQAAASLQQSAGEFAKRAGKIRLSEAGTRVKDRLFADEAPKDLQGATANFLRATAEDPGGMAAFILETAGESVPTLLAASAVTAATRSPNAGIAVLGASSGLTERYTTPVEYFSSKGIDVSTPEGAAAAVANRELMAEAANKGLIRGWIIGGLDAVSGGIAGKALVRSPAGDMALQMAAQMVAGGAGEGLAQYATEGEVDFNEVILEAVAEMATAPLEVAGVAGRRLGATTRQADEAVSTRAVFEALSGQATTSRTRARLPEQFRAFVDRLTVDGPLENVSVPAEAFQTYFQGKGLDPLEIATELGLDRETVAAALQTNGDIAIPTAVYAERLAGSEHDAFLLDNMRFDPDAMTSAEAKLFQQNAEAITREAAEATAAFQADEADAATAETTVADIVTQRLVSAGLPQERARHEGMLHGAFYRSMAKRTGMSMADTIARYPLVDVRRTGATAAEQGTYDQLVYHGTPHLFEKFDISQIGTGEGAQVFGWGLYFAGKREISEWYRDVLSSRASTPAVNGVFMDGASIDSYSNKRSVGEDDKLRRLIDRVKDRLPKNGSAEDSMAVGKAMAEEVRKDYETRRRAVVDAPVPPGFTPERWAERVATSLKLIDKDLPFVEFVEGFDFSRLGYRKQKAKKVKGRLFTVEIDEDNRFLHYDDKISDQDPSVLDSVRAAYEMAHAEEEANLRADLAPPAAPSPAPSSPRMSAKLDSIAAFFDDPLLNPPDQTLEDLERQAADARTTETENRIAALRERQRQRIEELPNRTGLQAYNTLSQILSNEKILQLDEVDRGASDKKASLLLRDAGLVGLSHLDNSSRGVTGDDVGKTRNYVLFTDEAARVVSYDQSDRASVQALYDAAVARRSPEPVLAAIRQRLAAFDQPDQDSDPFDASDAEVEAAIDGTPPQAAAPTPGTRKRRSRSRPSGVRGNVRIARKQDGSFVEPIVSLFATADLSTFLHESGHVFLTYLQAAALSPDATPEMRTEYQVILDWIASNAADTAADANRARSGGDPTVTAQNVLDAVTNGTSGDARIDQLIDVGMQEQWARGFETYLLEGKAPTKELREAFERFRAWLLEVYRNVTGLGVTLSPEIRGVFDRMLAADDVVQRTTGRDASRDMMADTAAGLRVDQETYDTLKRLHDEANAIVSQRTLTVAMDPIRRRRTKAWREERKAVRAEVETEVNQRRVFRVIEALGNGRWINGDAPVDVPSDLKLSRRDLVDRYGEDALKKLPRGRQYVYAAEGGMDLDEVAGWFGYASGDELFQELSAATTRNETIDVETEARMAELHGETLSEGVLTEAAEKAYRNETRARVIAEELKIIEKEAGAQRAATTVSFARAIARRTLAGMPVKQAVRTKSFEAAERRSGIAAQEAFRKGDAKAAERAKRAQLLNHMMAIESERISEEVASFRTRSKRLRKAVSNDRLGRTYVDAIVELLDEYDVRIGRDAADRRRERLQTFVDEMTAAGRENEIAVDPALLEPPVSTAISGLTVERLRGVIDTLRNIEHMARAEGKLIEEGRERDLAEIVTAIAGLADVNLPKRPTARTRGGRTFGDKIRTKGRQYVDLILNADTILRNVDGWTDLGRAYTEVKRGIDEAMQRSVAMRQDAAKRLDAIFGVYSAKEKRSMTRLIHVPELGYALSKWDMLAIAFNTGNADNLQRLTNDKVRGSLTPEQVQAVLGRLDARDAAVVQGVWDHLESYWPLLEAREKRVTGVAPRKVEAQPVVIGGVELAGGYYPIKYDSDQVGGLRVGDETQEDLLASQLGGRNAKASTRNGHTKARTGSSLPILIDVNVLYGHVNALIHDLTLGEPVNATWRILNNNGVRDAFVAAGRLPDYDALVYWIQDVAAGPLSASDVLSRTFRQLRSNFTVSKLALNITTVALQVTGFAQTSVVIGKKWTALGYLEYMKNGFTPDGRTPTNAARVIERSTFMRERQTTFDRDLYDIANGSNRGPWMGTYQTIMKDYVAPFMMMAIGKMQFYAVDLPTWIGAYRKGLGELGMTDDDAGFYADRMVSRAQTSAVFSDRSSIERGTVGKSTRQNDFVKLFTTLGSYMFFKFNVAYERTAKTNLKSPLEVLSLTADLAILFVLEGILAAAIRGQLPDDEDDEDDGWLAFLTKTTAGTVAGMFPGIRDLAGAASGFSGGTYATLTADFAKVLQEANGIANGEEADKGTLKIANVAAGYMLGTPSTAINRVIDATAKEWSGEDTSPLEFIFGVKQ